MIAAVAAIVTLSHRSPRYEIARYPKEAAHFLLAARTAAA
jgi:hypothetical protein